MIAFWILAPIMVLAALGVLFVRKAVHAALLMAVVMISLAVLYATLDAPFLFAVQIIVYTGAILMLFLFVVMLVGVDAAADETPEKIAGQRPLALVTGLLLGTLLITGILQAGVGAAVGLGDANAGGNIQALADLLFSRYLLAFEITAALLITAALGAMLLAHRERLTPRETQRDLVTRRMQQYAESGAHPGPLPPPGVFARHNAVDTPALLPDGRPAEASVSRVLAARGDVQEAPSADIERVEGQLSGDLPDSAVDAPADHEGSDR